MGVRNDTVSAADAGRLLLDGALLGRPPARASRAEVLRTVKALGFVQIDSIHSVERAHHLILHSRLDGYSPEMLAHHTETKRTVFEHWTHDASFIRADWMPWWTHRFESAHARMNSQAWMRERLGPRAKSVIAQVRKAITERGPSTTRDFPKPPRLGQGWWDWSPQKAALEYLWRTGEIAVHSRRGFDKVYEITERVHGARPAKPPRAKLVDWACAEAIARLGTATAREIAHFMNAVTLAEARKWCEDATRRGTVAPVMLGRASNRTLAGIACLDWHERAKSFSADSTPRLLSPFDPIIRDRARALDLFGFDYRFEAFVPAPKRKYGYYTMPVLAGEKLVARVDLASKREESVLKVSRVWLEPGRLTAQSRRVVASACERLAGQLKFKVDMCAIS